MLAPLVQGDLIDIVAPGSASDTALILRACAVLESWGYQTRVPNNLMQPDLFLSNSDDYRFKTLKNALCASDSQAIWCVRGGYGSLRLLPQLNKLKKPKHKKLLIGFSDMTSIQLFLTQSWNWPSLHGPLLDRLGAENLQLENFQEVRRLLTGSQYETVFSKLKPINLAAKKAKLIEGSISGGNLMVSTSTLGTENQICGDGKILFFEELSERGYRIDRCLQQMKQAGVFKNACAIIFGDFLKCHEPSGEDLSLPTLKKFFKDHKIPAFKGVELGHGPIQRPLFFNTKAKIFPMATSQSQTKMVVYSPYEVLKPRK